MLVFAATSCTHQQESSYGLPFHTWTVLAPQFSLEGALEP
jgi:hypothetical protein